MKIFKSQLICENWIFFQYLLRWWAQVSRMKIEDKAKITLSNINLNQNSMGPSSLAKEIMKLVDIDQSKNARVIKLKYYLLFN